MNGLYKIAQKIKNLKFGQSDLWDFTVFFLQKNLET